MTLFRLPAALLIPLRPLALASYNKDQSISVWGHHSVCWFSQEHCPAPKAQRSSLTEPHELPDHANVPISRGILALSCVFSDPVKSTVLVLFCFHPTSPCRLSAPLECLPWLCPVPLRDVNDTHNIQFPRNTEILRVCVGSTSLTRPFQLKITLTNFAIFITICWSGFVWILLFSLLTRSSDSGKVCEERTHTLLPSPCRHFANLSIRR